MIHKHRIDRAVSRAIRAYHGAERDTLGSYTGTPSDSSVPTQDADDL